MFYENALKNTNKLSKNAISNLTKYFGLLCNIYYPQNTENIYNDSSQDYEYSNNPDISDYFLVTNLNHLSAFSQVDSLSMSPFGFEELYILTINEEYFDIERNSKIEIFFNSSFFTFKILNRYVINGNDNQPIYVKYTLIPYT